MAGVQDVLAFLSLLLVLQVRVDSELVQKCVPPAGNPGCVCQMNAGLVDLTTLADSNGFPRFTCVLGPGGDSYSCNPCYSFTATSDCSSTAGCQNGLISTGAIDTEAMYVFNGDQSAFLVYMDGTLGKFVVGMLVIVVVVPACLCYKKSCYKSLKINNMPKNMTKKQYHSIDVVGVSDGCISLISRRLPHVPTADLLKLKLTPEGHWVVTSVNEDQEINPDYTESFTHTFSALIGSLVRKLVQQQEENKQLQQELQSSKEQSAEKEKHLLHELTKTNTANKRLNVELKLVKKMARAKDAEIDQLESRVKSSEGALYEKKQVIMTYEEEIAKYQAKVTGLESMSANKDTLLIKHAAELAKVNQLFKAEVNEKEELKHKLEEHQTSHLKVPAPPSAAAVQADKPSKTEILPSPRPCDNCESCVHLLRTEVSQCDRSRSAKTSCMYLSQVFYHPFQKEYVWQLDFVVTRYTLGAKVQEYYKGRGWCIHHEQPLQFQESENDSEKTLTVQIAKPSSWHDQWLIEPVNSPMIMKSDVDRMMISFPCYSRQSVQWKGKPRNTFPTVSRKVKLKGVKYQYSQFMIKLPGIDCSSLQVAADVVSVLSGQRVLSAQSLLPGASTPELGERAKKILHEHAYTLQNQLQNIVIPVKAKLVQQGIIDYEAVDLGVLGMSDLHKAEILYKAVVISLESNPDNFPKLVSILGSFTTLTTVVDKLKKAGKNAGLFQ